MHPSPWQLPRFEPQPWDSAAWGWQENYFGLLKAWQKLGMMSGALGNCGCEGGLRPKW